LTAPVVRRIVILHGLSATNNSDWYQAVASHFELLGCEVLAPNFPGAHAPNLNRWSLALHRELEQKNWEFDENLSLIGHSTGVMAALRFVETLPPGTRLGPCIFVAGFPAALLVPTVPTFVARRPRLPLIKPKLPKILAVYSKNDWRVPIGPNAEWFEKELNAVVYAVDKAGHFIKRHGWVDWNDELYKRVEAVLEL
jgi:predicted alpha/beta hydrolase family esterase